MADLKLIHKERLSITDSQKKQLRYADLFEVDDDKDIDYKEALEKNNIEWTRRLNQARQESIKQGYEAGFEEGQLQARDRIDEQLNNFQRSLTQLDKKLDTLVEQLKPAVTSLVFDIAEKVIGVPHTDPNLSTWVAQTVADCLEEITHSAKIEIIVSEYDYETVHDLVQKMPAVSSISIDYTDTLNPGEFELHTPHEAVKNNFAKKLADIRQSLPLKDWGA